MSKKRRQNTKKRRKARSPYADHLISGIGEHKRQGRKLSPPLAQLSMMTPSSWMDDHMPEMLWAVLLTGALNRRDYLICFRKIAALSRGWFKKSEEEASVSEKAPDPKDGINWTVVVDHTTLADISEDHFEQFISIVLKHPLGYAALRPLLLIGALPGFDRWKRRLDVQPSADDWETLAKAVAGVLDHQSEASTDIRWFKLIVATISGRLRYPSSMEERLDLLRFYPDKGDMRQVRPFIRSGEMMLRRSPPSAWINEFWTVAFENTVCIDPSSDEYAFNETVINPKPLYQARRQVVARFLMKMSAKRTDARLDSAFGLVLYALSIVEEIGFHRIQTRIVGRLALRALVEANVTLRYLLEKDNTELWMSYRVYGAGQAKLAFLKAQELEGDLPSFLDEHTLFAIANEDIWHEFLDIDVGHWANSNLRALALKSGAKDIYDKYYDWASAFVHGHWGAVRDTNFVTCHNPLHRLHRIPRLSQRGMNSVELDAIDLVNQMLELLDNKFSDTEPFQRLSLVHVDEARVKKGDTEDNQGGVL